MKEKKIRRRKEKEGKSEKETNIRKKGLREGRKEGAEGFE